MQIKLDLDKKRLVEILEELKQIRNTQRGYIRVYLSGAIQEIDATIDYYDEYNKTR